MLRFACPLFAVLLCWLLPVHAAEDAPILRLETGGHTGAIEDITFSPDGRKLASVGRDCVVRIWDTATGAQEQVLRYQLPPSGGSLGGVAYSHDGRFVAVAGWLSGDAVGMVFNAQSGEPALVLKAGTHGASRLAWSPDGHTIAVGMNRPAGTPVTVALFDAGTGAAQGLLEGPRGVAPTDANVLGLAFSPDGRRLLALTNDATASIWSLDTRSCTRTWRAHDSSGWRAVWSPDGRYVVTAGHEIRIWDATTGALSVTLPAGDATFGLALAPNGRYLAAASAAGEGQPAGRVWSFPDGRLLRQFAVPSRMGVATAVAPDCTRFAFAGGARNEIALYDIESGAPLRHLLGGGESIASVAWSRDGGTIGWAPGWCDASSAVNPTRALPSRGMEVRNAVGPAGRLPEWASRAYPEGWRASHSDAGIHIEAPGGAMEIACGPWRTLCAAPLSGRRVILGGAELLSLYARDGKRIASFTGQGGSDSHVQTVAVSPDERYLLAGGRNQLLCIYPLAGLPERAEGKAMAVAPILSLFSSAAGEWVAWTPEGYYTCSPGGERLIGWQVNRGIDQTPDFFHVYQFRRRFYRPDVISRLLDAGGVAGAVKLADAARRQRTDVPQTAQDLRRFAPPRVEIIAPAEGAVANTPTVRVRARVTDPNGRKITALVLLVNGRRVGERDLVVTADTDAGLIEREVPLLPGENTLSLIAVNDAGSECAPVGVRVTYQVADSDAARPALYVLAVGVSRYGNPQFSLRYAAKDAQDLAGALQRQGGRLFRKVTCRVLTDAQATKGEVLDGLDWLSREVTQRDYALVFVSGHGLTDTQSNYYFLPHDGDPEKLKRTGVFWSDFSSTLSGLPGKVFLVLDTCHAGAQGTSRTRGFDAYTDLLREAASDDVGLITFASCMPREQSLEDGAWGNGAFTRALIDGLAGKADANGDKVITLAELDAYLSERVKELTGGRQHPTTQRPTTIRSSLPMALAP